LVERWIAASVAKKCIAAAGSTVLGMATLVAFVLLGTSISPRIFGFGFLGVVVVAVIAVVAIAVRESHNFPMPTVPKRHSAGDSGMSQAAWNRHVDGKLS
jgi:hypothetical protein